MERASERARLGAGGRERGVEVKYDSSRRPSFTTSANHGSRGGWGRRS
jgi:hypothetical protein